MWMPIVAYLTSFWGCVQGEQSAPTLLRDYLTASDRQKLMVVFQSAIEIQEISSIHYALAGHKLLGKRLDETVEKNLCEKIKQSARLKDLKHMYHLTEAMNYLNNCSWDGDKKVTENKIRDVIKNESKSDSKTLFYALTIATNLEVEVDHDEVDRILTASFNGNRLESSGYIYAFASLCLLPSQLAGKHFHRVDHLVMQADKIDGKILKFLGGLSLTGLAISSVYNLSRHVKKAPTFTQDTMLFFSNYFLSRKSVNHERGAFFLLQALTDMTSDGNFTPLVAVLVSKRALQIAEPQVILRLKVCNLMGGAYATENVILTSITHSASNSIVAGILDVELAKDATDDTDTIYKGKLDRKLLPTGQLTLNFSIHMSTIEQHFRSGNASFTVNATSKFNVMEVIVTMIDTLTKQEAKISVAYAEKFPKIFHSTTNKKLSVVFSVFDAASSDPVRVHQCFFLFVHVKTAKEVGFIAQFDRKTKSYIFSLETKEFYGVNGKYRVWLLVGDAMMVNTIKWNLFDAFVDSSSKKRHGKPLAPETPKLFATAGGFMPELEHQFSVREGQYISRYGRVASAIFSVFCSAPFFFGFVMWAFFGFDNHNSVQWPLYFWAAGFHLCLFLILAMYALFWLYLVDMMFVLKILVEIGFLFFVFGNRLLNMLALKRQEEEAKARGHVHEVESECAEEEEDDEDEQLRAKFGGLMEEDEEDSCFSCEMYEFVDDDEVEVCW